MVLEFKIGNTVVEEPIGFDSFEVTLERGSEHGIGAESSVGTVEFYGVGFGIVKAAYLADLDTQLVFTVGMKCSDADTTFTQIYSGVIDLTSYVENVGDYCSCQVSVGEIGSMTTFINRADTEVNLVDGVMTDLDGNALSSVQLSKTVSIPSKELTLTDKLYEDDNTSNTLIGTITGSFDDFIGVPIVVGFDSAQMNELGFSSSVDEFRKIVFDGIKINEIPPTIESTGYTISIDLSIYLSFIKYGNVAIFGDVTLRVVIYDYNDDSIDMPLQGDTVFSMNQTTFSQATLISNQSTWTTTGSVFGIKKILVYLYTRADFDGETQTLPIECYLLKEVAKIDISSTTQTVASTAKLTMPHEAFNRLANVYGDLTVKSDWYSREDAAVNPISSGVVGGGALKGMLNGLQLRNAFALSTNPTLFTQSFKSLFLSLKSIDNIGWGFSTESGVIYIRVENWKWFYKSDVILTIDNPKEKTRKPIIENIYSRAKVGYKKFFAVEDINSVDTIHTERSYNNGLKAIDKEVTFLSDLVADPFAIEVTRRLSLIKDTKDWKFDDNVFVLAMSFLSGVYYIEQGYVSSSNFTSPNTTFNTRISPARNALRLADSLFGVNKPEYRLTASKGNVAASGKSVTSSYYTLDDLSADSVLSEGADIAQPTRLLSGEKIEVEHPISFSDYQTVKANPYGTVVIDGEETFIEKAIYSPITSMAKLTLLVKAV